MYEKRGSLLKFWFIITMFIIAVIFVFYSTYVWLQWSILETMYLQKAGLDWFNTNYYYGYTFILAAILALLVLNPRIGRSDIYELWESIRRLTRTEYKTKIQPTFSLKTRKIFWSIWQLVKWGIASSVIISLNGLPFLGKVTPAFYMVLRNVGDWSFVPRVFLLAIMPASSNELVSLVPTMEAHYSLIYVLSVAVLAIAAVRMVLKIIKHFMQEPRNIWIRDLFVILSLAMAAIILGAPFWTMDATTPFDYLISLLLLIGFVAAAIYFQFIGLEKNFSFAKRKRMVFTGLGLAIIVILVLNAVILAGFRLNWNNNWIEYEWKPLTEKQISVTRWAAGIQNIERKSIMDLPMGNLSKTLSQIRQWDQNAAYTRMINRIGANWMTLADSDILYVNGREYWAAPTTLLYPSTDWISKHLIYTHTSKIIMIDSHTGDYVNVTDAFGISKEPLIYYGEGFDTPVYVNVKGFNEVEGVSYAGAPDYILSGWQRSLWFLSQGQFGFASSPPQDSINMLYNRDVLKRVKDVLIYGLSVDTDAYLVSDGKNVYYAVQVYIDYPLRSGFSESNYLRFFALILINVEDGAMQGYVVGQSDGFLVDFYKNYYPSWKSIDDPSVDWLIPQMRYPEKLLGKRDAAGQLDIDFKFHVEDPFIWRSGTEFYERPPRTEILYVLVTDQNKTYFVGLQIVEYLGSAGKNLAGMYLAFGGENLGRTVFYEVPKTMQLLGPTAAETSLIANETVQSKLTLYGYYQNPPTARLGNILLYPIAGKLYYFIPLYLVGGVMSTMPEIGILDASYGSMVATGTNAEDAYRNLVGGIPGGEVTAEKRLGRIFKVFRDAGLELLNVTAVYPHVEVLVKNLTYVEERQWVETESAINEFIESYAVEKKILVWYADRETVNLGILIKEGDFVYLYYLSIRYR